MEKYKINPEKITKPMQLLAAWLVGLLLVLSALLTAAGTIKEPSWLPAFLAISAVAIIPLFLILIFLLQTKYRPQMQDDHHYSRYLNKDTLRVESVNNVTATGNINIKKIEQEVEDVAKNFKKIEKIIEKSDIPKKNIDKDYKNINQKLDDLKIIAKFAGLKIWLNVKLHRYKEICQAIEKMNYPFKYINKFGKDSTPSIFLISFGENITIDIARDIIFKLIPFGAEYVAIAQKNEINSDNIYIGSYGYRGNAKISKIEPYLIDKLNEANGQLPFYKFYQKTLNEQ